MTTDRTLQDRGLLCPATVAQEAAEAEQASRHVHQLIDELEATIGHDRYVELDNAVCALESAIATEISARLLEVLVAANTVSVPLFAAPTATVLK